MNQTFEILGFNKVKIELAELCNTQKAKEQAALLQPIMREIQLRKSIEETKQARILLEKLGTPPLPLMDKVESLVTKADAGELMTPEELSYIGTFLTAVKRMKDYLLRGCEMQVGIAFYVENLKTLEEIQREIGRCIRNGQIDDYASANLKELRKKKIQLEEKIKAKAESIMKNQKSAMAENFVVMRNGKICLPVKKECKGMVPGSVLDKSSTGATLFIEPTSVQLLSEELEIIKMDEDHEERIILYTLGGMIADHREIFITNGQTIEKLDFFFAKGKLSINMEGVEPEINTQGVIQMKQARHPQLLKETCVPLNLEIGNLHKGIIITGPNTGGKTVAMKTVGIVTLMACSGLFVPCESANVSMCNQVLTDIGDGQNIVDNLSTFSAHITNIIEILKNVTRESLVLLDELGSGTDPAEGMGIAIAVMEQLRKKECLFIVTTHYPEVKEYGEKESGIINARMAFDRNDLKPLYKLEIGKSGESCALYIAKRLGMPDFMIEFAAQQTYKEGSREIIEDLHLNDTGKNYIQQNPVPSIERKKESNNLQNNIYPYQRGDSVEILPDGRIGIVVKTPNEQGNLIVMVQKEKIEMNHKRLKLKVAATQLYPEDYDFSIIFDSVEVRKGRHQMNKRHQEGLILEVES